MDLTGQTLGQYRIIEKIGRGGMAEVYKAFQPRLERYVALKVLPPYFAHDETFLERFEREAKAVASLRHPNILTIHDYGEQEGLTYLVMEYVEGGTLQQRLGQPLDVLWTAEIVGRVGDALAYAHRRGVIHRDVKPANILMREGDWPLLSDFGLARMVEQSIHLTKTGVGIGTPEYMSPEQGQGQKIDERTDIYSLGVVLYEMVTGQKPFQADTPIAVVLKHVTAPLPLPRRINPDVPESIEWVILKAMAKSPDDRFQRMGEMARALEEAAAEITATAREAERRARAEEEKKLAGLYGQATAAQQAGQWAEAVGLFEEILALRPGYRDAKARLSAAQKALEEEKGRREREEKLVALYGQAEEALGAREWTKAKELLEEVLALDASYRNSQQLLAHARWEMAAEEEERRVNALYERGVANLEAGRWSQAIIVFEKVLAQRTEHAEAAARLEAARRGQELASLYDQAQKAIKSERWSAAVESLEKIVGLEAGYRDSQALLVQARERLAEKAWAEAVEPVVLVEEEEAAPFWRRVPVWGWAAVGAAVLLITVGAILLGDRGGKPTPAPVAMPAPTATAVPTVPPVPPTPTPVVPTDTPTPVPTDAPTPTTISTETPTATPTVTPAPSLTSTPTPIPPTATPIRPTLIDEMRDFVKSQGITFSVVINDPENANAADFEKLAKAGVGEVFFEIDSGEIDQVSDMASIIDAARTAGIAKVKFLVVGKPEWAYHTLQRTKGERDKNFPESPGAVDDAKTTFSKLMDGADALKQQGAVVNGFALQINPSEDYRWRDPAYSAIIKDDVLKGYSTLRDGLVDMVDVRGYTFDDFPFGWFTSTNPTGNDRLSGYIPYWGKNGNGMMYVQTSTPSEWDIYNMISKKDNYGNSFDKAPYGFGIDAAAFSNNETGIVWLVKNVVSYEISNKSPIRGACITGSIDSIRTTLDTWATTPMPTALMPTDTPTPVASVALGPCCESLQPGKAMIWLENHHGNAVSADVGPNYYEIPGKQPDNTGRLRTPGCLCLQVDPGHYVIVVEVLGRSGRGSFETDIVAGEMWHCIVQVLTDGGQCTRL